MKNKNVLIALGLAAVGGVVYFASKVKKQKGLITDAEIKANQDAQAAADALAKAKKNAQADSESLQNKNSLAAKVAVIQLYLGVNADGIVGQNTNMALQKKFPAYSTITTANVDKIIADIDANKKSSEQLSSQTTQTVLLQEKVALAKKLETLTDGGNYYAELTANINAPEYQFDNLTNSYRFMNVYRTFQKGSKFYANQLTSRGNGEIMIKNGLKRFATNPLNFIIKTK